MKNRIIILPYNYTHGSIRKAANQAIGAGVITKVTFDTIISIDGVTFNTGTNDFTISEAGFYLLTMCCQMAASAAANHRAEIYVNGNRYGHSTDGNTAVVASMNVAVTAMLAAGDVIDGRVFTSIAKNVVAQFSQPNLAVVKLHD